MEFFIGMMVIGIVAGVFVMTLLFHSEGGFFVGRNSGKRMMIEFNNGAGISQNSLVLKSGIKIGRVYSVVLLDEMGDSRVRVSFELEPEAKIYSNEVAKINRTFLGDASIEIVDDPNYVGEIVEVDVGTTLRSLKTGDIMSTVSNLEGDLGAALQNVNAATAGVAEFMSKANAFFGNEQEIEEKKARLQGVFTELGDTLASVKELASHMDEIVTDEQLKSNIMAATDKIPAIMKRVDEIATKANDFMDNANTMSSDVRKTLARAGSTFDLVDKNLDNANVFTTSLAEKGPQMMTALNEGAQEIRGAIGEVKGAIDNIAKLANSINERVGDPDTPLGLLSDKQVATDLRNFISNAEELTEKLYPIFDDARVFSNKIAHKPSSLIWDKTTTKGGALSEKFGWQTKTPTGGVSSAMYRQTPAGARISQKNYYQPAADTDFMDPQTRAAYENELACRARMNQSSDSLDAYAQSFPDGDLARKYAGVLPETNGGNVKSCGFAVVDKIKEKTTRVRWSLDSFFSKFAPKRRAVTAEYVDYEGMTYGGGTNNVVLENAPYFTEGTFIQGAYGDDPNSCFANDGIQVNFVPNDQFQTAYYANGNCEVNECGVAPCEPGCAPTCEPGCETSCSNDFSAGCAPTCDATPDCANGSCSTGSGMRSAGAGYQPQSVGAYNGGENTGDNVRSNSLGAYRGDELKQMKITSAEGEEIEELPSSINRIASPNASRNMDGGAFEDDGLPVEFAPPTQR